mmetsp:Transcript_20592/g.38330  ORF Transcript_20592/g.38330 Transcript_20592/m.38330 type:complete len:170 (-) Transcript_20592:80-589(-)
MVSSHTRSFQDFWNITTDQRCGKKIANLLFEIDSGGLRPYLSGMITRSYGSNWHRLLMEGKPVKYCESLSNPRQVNFSHLFQGKSESHKAACSSSAPSNTVSNAERENEVKARKQLELYLGPINSKKWARPCTWMDSQPGLTNQWQHSKWANSSTFFPLCTLSSPSEQT